MLSVSEMQVYEADIMDGPGRHLGIMTFEFATDADAIAWRRDYLQCNPGRCIKIHRIPFVNESMIPSCYLWPEDFHLVAHIEG
jgi:hypothetical protein